MSKEELKKEAEEYALKQWEGNLPWSVIQKSYYDGALSRENQIQIDAEQIRALQKQNGELTDKVKELETQVEEMKKYGKLLQDICVVLGNDNYMVSVQLDKVVDNLWDCDEEKQGHEMVESILDRLLKITAIEWNEISKWEIKEK